MAKKFNVYMETEDGGSTYMGTYHSKTFNEACQLCIIDNGLDPNYYDKKNRTYEGYQLMDKEKEEP